MTDQLELTLGNDRSEIPRLQDELEAFGQRHNLAARALHDVQLALEEHLANILNYGYDDSQEHQIRVHVQLKTPELLIEVEDDGHAFNPLEQPVPDISKPIEKRPVGGLGIHMMRKSLDGIEYRRENGKNILTMIKRV